jgi:hypothetical protein
MSPIYARQCLRGDGLNEGYGFAPLMTYILLASTNFHFHKIDLIVVEKEKAEDVLLNYIYRGFSNCQNCQQNGLKNVHSSMG